MGFPPLWLRGAMLRSRMVTAPRCKVCGANHWLWAGHEWGSKPVPLVLEAVEPAAGPPKLAGRKTRKPPVVKKASKPVDPATVPGVTRGVALEGGPKRDRAAYMREYRAKQRGES